MNITGFIFIVFGTLLISSPLTEQNQRLQIRSRIFFNLKQNQKPNSRASTRGGGFILGSTNNGEIQPSRGFISGSITELGPNSNNNQAQSSGGLIPNSGFSNNQGQSNGNIISSLTNTQGQGFNNNGVQNNGGSTLSSNNRPQQSIGGFLLSTNNEQAVLTSNSSPGTSNVVQGQFSSNNQVLSSAQGQGFSNTFQQNTDNFSTGQGLGFNNNQGQNSGGFNNEQVAGNSQGGFSGQVSNNNQGQSSINGFNNGQGLGFSNNNQGGLNRETTIRNPYVTIVNAVNGEFSLSNELVQCIRRCPSTSQFNPVCGSDNISYTNEARLQCAQKCGRSKLYKSKSYCLLINIKYKHYK